MASSECDMMMNFDDEDQNQCSSSSQQMSGFALPGSSSPSQGWPSGSSQRERFKSNSSSTHQRSRAWKCPPSRPSPRSSASGGPLSSPTPLSRAYISKSTNPSPSELRQRAANALRSIERRKRSNAHRPLLDAFTIGTRRGIDETTTNKEEMMTEAIDRRYIRQMNRQWEELLSSRTDELIEEAEEDDISMDEESLDTVLGVDPSQIYAEYELPQDENTEQDTSMSSTASTVLASCTPGSLLSVLLDASSSCPACSGGGLRSSEGQGIECPHCDWCLNGSTLQSVDHHFHQHGDRSIHHPVVGYNPHIGTNFVCSNPDCDEWVCV